MSSSRIRPATLRVYGRDLTARTRPGVFENRRIGYWHPMNDSRAHQAATTPAPEQPGTEPTLGALVHQLSEQVPELIRSELRLAQAEMAEKGKRAGLGIGMFSAAGLLAFFGLATLITTAILALALVLPAWLAALVVALLLLAGAGGMAMVGKKKVEEAVPPVPERAVEGVKEDIATVKGARS